MLSVISCTETLNKPLCSQCSGSKGGQEEKKGGHSLQEVKRRGRMERSRDDEEEVNDRLKTLVSHQDESDQLRSLK